MERDHFAHSQQCVFLASSDIVPEASDPTALHPEIQVQVSRLRTDMDRFRQIEISGLIRHGYCVARHVCRSMPPPLSDNIGQDPPWDPTADATAITKGPELAKVGRGFENVTAAARTLQVGTRRRLWGSLLDPRDWVTWIYLPLIVLVLGVLPLFAYRTYRHVRVNAALTRAVAEMREDFSKMLELLEFGPPENLVSMEVETVDRLAPRLAEQGLDIISDNRITDLREWVSNRVGVPRQVFVYRHVLVRKNSEATRIPALRLQSHWDTPDLLVNCENAALKPVLQRRHRSPDRNPKGLFDWAVMLDFSDVPIGETVEVVVNIMQAAAPDDRRLGAKQWWQFEVDANPEVATCWILLPSDRPHADFSVVRSRNDDPDVMELVRPTHQTRMYGGSVISWSVVHPEPGFTYSSHWNWE